MAKVITASQAAELVKDGALILWPTFGMASNATEVVDAVEKRFLETGHPANIISVHAAGAGDFAPLGKDKGESHWCHKGLLKTYIGSHAGSSQGLMKALEEDTIEAFSMPLGVMLQLYREIARKGPGLFSKVGLNTYCDPRQQGGILNPSAEKSGRVLCEVKEIDGEEWLFYKKFNVDIGLIRGTTADAKGNISIEKEGLNLELLTVAQAAKACGGIVIAQVESLAIAGTLNPKAVKVPGIYVDYIVVAEKPQPQTMNSDMPYNRSFSGEIKVPMGAIPPIPLTEDKIIARRSAMEVYPGSLNLGIGIPTFIPSIAAEEGCSDMFTLISESGSIGGVPGAARDFGHHWNIESSTDQGDHFNYYDGVGVDIGIYGLGETDEEGNVNTSNLNGRIIGVGGFMNVTLNAKGAFFVGTFTAGGLKTKVENGKLVILQEGKYKKFVKRVSQLTFNGNQARKTGQKVAFITERCVLILDPKAGLTLTEIAPGVDLEKDILAHMDFKPVLPSGGPKLMDPGIFQPTWGGMRALMEKKAKDMGIEI